MAFSFDKSYLRELYLKEEKSIDQIAKENNVSASTIRKCLIHYNIPRRTLSEIAKKRIGNKNHFYGKKHNQETKKQMSELMKNKYLKERNPFYGKHHTEETKRKIGIANKRPNPKSSETLKKLYKEGKIKPWNKGKKGLQIAWNKGKTNVYSKDFLLRMSLARKGKSNWGINPIKDIERKRKLSESKKGFKHTEETKEKIRKQKMGKTWEEIHGKEKAEAMKKEMSKRHSKPKSENYKQKMKEAWKKGVYKNVIKKGNDHPNWRGGISNLPYAYNWEKISKEIRKRDSYVCQLCGDKILKNTEKKFLVGHHINYNKQDNDYSNLITLCNHCNASVNFKREDWTKYFQNKMEEKIIWQ